MEVVCDRNSVQILPCNYYVICQNRYYLPFLWVAVAQGYNQCLIIQSARHLRMAATNYCKLLWIQASAKCKFHHAEISCDRIGPEQVNPKSVQCYIILTAKARVTVGSGSAVVCKC